MKFKIKGKLKMTRVDHQAPYALFGDNNGHYNQWTPRPGSYSLKATPFSQADAQGQAGLLLTIHFTVVRKPAAMLAARLAPAPAPGLMLYPNPTSDGRLQVQLPVKWQGPVRYSLFSSVGSKLKAGTISLDHTSSLLEFDFSNQVRAPGLYFLRLEGANMQQVFKILRR